MYISRVCTNRAAPPNWYEIFRNANTAAVPGSIDSWPHVLSTPFTYPRDPLLPPSPPHPKLSCRLAAGYCDDPGWSLINNHTKHVRTVLVASPFQSLRVHHRLPFFPIDGRTDGQKEWSEGGVDSTEKTISPYSHSNPLCDTDTKSLYSLRPSMCVLSFPFRLFTF